MEHLWPFHCSSACTSPVYPLTPQPLSDRRGGAASSKRITQRLMFSWAEPPSIREPVCSRTVKVPPPRLSCAARDWLTTHLLHAACPVLYCVSIINNNLAPLTGMTVINMHRFNFVKGGLCVGQSLRVPTFGAIVCLEMKSWCLLTTRRSASFFFSQRKSDRWREGAGRERLTDLFSRTLPAGSHLSETLPPVRGLGAPDKTTQETASSQREGKRLCLRLPAGVLPCTSVHKYQPPHTLVCLLYSSVCAHSTDMSNAAY